MRHRLALAGILAVALGACGGERSPTAPEALVQQENEGVFIGSGDGVMIGSGHSTGTETPPPSEPERGGVTIGSGH